MRYVNQLNSAAQVWLFKFHDRMIECSMFIPNGADYNSINPEERICATTGAAAGADFVDGDAYLALNFRYDSSHLWR